MKRLSQRIKDGKRDIQEKFPRQNKTGGTPNGISNTDSAAKKAPVTDAHPPALQSVEYLEVHGPSTELDNDSATELDLDDFDLTPRAARNGEMYTLERKSLLMFSKAHMRIIMQDFKLLRKFAAFMVEERPERVQLLAYHLDCRKALAAINFSNVVVGGMSLSSASVADGGVGATPPATTNEELWKRADESFHQLASEDLPAWVTSVWIKAVEVSIRMRIIGSLPSQLRDMSEGLAETFCLSDPSRSDNPMVFASEGFIKLTQYSNKYTLGRNCRILRGKRTSINSTRRLGRQIANAQEHHEAVLNYRRDGTPFMNLLMVTPLFDAQGKARYFLGAQIDVSGLLTDFHGFEYLHKFFDHKGHIVRDEEEDMASSFDTGRTKKDELRELSELLNPSELDVVRKHGGRLHRPDMEVPENIQVEEHMDRLVLSDSPTSDHIPSSEVNNVLGGGMQTTTSTADNGHGNPLHLTNGHTEATAGEVTENGGPSAADDQISTAPSLEGVDHGGQLGCGLYDHYLLVRPAPSLRILFASPSLRGPGLVQSNLMDRVGASAQMRSRIEQALTRGQRVTAKIKWTPASVPASAGRNLWLHATPLLTKENEVGVWMVVLVDEERSSGGSVSERRAWSVHTADESIRPGTSSSVSLSVAGGTRSILKNPNDPASIILGLKAARNKGTEGVVAAPEAPASGDQEP